MFLRYNYLGILWAWVILFVCSIPPSEVPSFQPFPHFDKTIHFYMFAQFSFLLVVGFRKQYTFKTIQRFPFKNAFYMALLYGILIEILQFFVFSGRNFDVMDIAANFLGTIFGIFLVLLIYGKLSK